MEVSDDSSKDWIDWMHWLVEFNIVRDDSAGYRVINCLAILKSGMHIQGVMSASRFIRFDLCTRV